MKSLRAAALLLLFAGCAKEDEQPTAAGTAGAKSGAVSNPSLAPTPDAEGFVRVMISNDSVAEAKGGARALLPSVAVGNTVGETGTYLELIGTKRGYVYSVKPYRNFTLRFDYRWPNAAELPEAERPEANTGVLVFMTGEHKIWPKCLEVQGKWSEMGHIKSNAKDVTVTVRDDPAAREQARKPVGEWNAVEVVAKDGALTSTVNGVKIAESDPTELREGPIGFQAERFDVEFRNVRIREE